MTIRVRLFAALRDEAGASVVEAEGATAGEVADALALRYGRRFAKIASVGQVVVNGERADRTALTEGDESAAAAGLGRLTPGGSPSAFREHPGILGRTPPCASATSSSS
jgi:molybdopterin converting factor small subunit